MKSAIILLSGGLDSLVSLSIAMDQCDIRLAITCDYGQRAASRERTAAREICERFDIRHHIISLPWLGQITRTALVNRQKKVPTPTALQLDEQMASEKTARAVWVPNRNGLLINIAAAFAESKKCELILTGFNREEAITFADNSPEFISHVNHSLSFSTLNHPSVTSFVQEMTKQEMVSFCIQKDLPLEMTWPCYHDFNKWCGACESCKRFERALRNNEVLNKYQEYFLDSAEREKYHASI